MVRRTKSYSGTTSTQVSDREKRNRAVARKAAVEGIVLLQNDGILPLEPGTRIALFGGGATQTVKGGTGSGDVNEREVVSIHAGLKEAGFVITSESWLSDYDEEFKRARQAWKQGILDKAAEYPERSHGLLDAYFTTPFTRPAGRAPNRMELEEAGTETAIYVLSRNAGEGADRFAEAGDYYLSDAEKEHLTALKGTFPRMILVLNCGGPIDLAFLDEIPFGAVVQLSQPGMEAGNALADIITGTVSPSGKTTDTWAARYEDYPSSSTFSHNNGNVQTELYEEGIYVGYRYFDTFRVKPRVPFGFGLSYTEFTIRTLDVGLRDNGKGASSVSIDVEVVNTGKAHAGKEVVQVYASCPQGELTKEYQRLCGFGKTPVLKPGEACRMEITFPLSQLASYSEKDTAWILEKGDYLIAVGSSSASNEVVARIRLDRTTHILRTAPICPLRQPLEELEPDAVPQRTYDGAIIELALAADSIHSQTVQYSGATPEKMSGRAGDLVEDLSVEQLIALTSGDPEKGQDVSRSTDGASDLLVPGAAGETHGCAQGEPWNLATITLADGPAGIRLAPRYKVTADGKIMKPTIAESVEHGFFAEEVENPNAKAYYQYCTAIPVGTMLAQSWNVELMREIGVAVAEEMEEFGIALWLAPGMNIHRNPLCGRNFEYYSEDPLLTGVVASAITTGVQSRKGTGTTIKHFACNNQEDNRKHSDSVVSQRALREIYLHGFEIAVKHSQPMAIMTSYNLINGVHTANSHDLITKVARDEWGFAGFVMTDWTTTGDGGSSAVECMKAGNDLIMPGDYADLDQIRDALNGTGKETLDLKEVKKCVTHLVNIILQSNEYEDCASYAEQFSGMTAYMECRVGSEEHAT